MHLQQLVLRDFRNYEQLELPLARGLTTFVGLNGQGKTNLLEAVCFLASSKSPRTPRDRELIRWEQDFLCARADFATQHSSVNTAELVVTRSGDKRAKFNGAERRQLADWVGQLNQSAFFPEDVALVSGQPALRRQFLDQELSKLESQYRHHWVQYRRLLAQRNALLRELKYRHPRASSLPELSQQLATHGAHLIARRQAYVAQVVGHAASVHRRLSRDQEALTVRYDSTVPRGTADDPAAVEAAFLTELAAVRPRELEQGTTQVGPHRDDLALQLQGRDLRKFASQGQRRSAALALRLAAATVIRERLDEAPVLLLDDALSELDQERRFALLELASEMDQVLLTATDAELQGTRALASGKVLRVSQGSVLEITQ